jgi:hypothetical protein
MAQIFNPASSIPTNITNLAEVSVTAKAQSNEFKPFRTLKNSVASTAPQANPQNPNAAAIDAHNAESNFAAASADIPDAFATYESAKLKFLFTVQFFPRSGLTLPYSGDESMDKMTFALKKASRPNPSVTYQDINYYGYRTKVAIKLDYGTVTVGFYDDVVNRAHNVVSQYINFISPISTISKDNADSLSGMNADPTGGSNATTIGSFKPGAEKGPFSAMRITHYMVDDKSKGTAAKHVYYDYLNPKIINVNLDELDMSASEASMVEVTFVYDSVNISYSDAPTINPTVLDNTSNPIANIPSLGGAQPVGIAII